MNRLKELRTEKKLTQKELADIIGTTKLTVSNWENGKHSMNSDKAQALADYFEVSIAYLLGYENLGDPPVEAQLVLGKMLVDTIEYIEKSVWLCGQKQTLFVNGHEYKVTVEKVGVRK
ncbi:helix-turn-helix transcriptional regulator [Streptococcus danieliae]|uniref:Helix-turn-helix transcriptional regulator n=1 Tax=Streptococcus danieliae TaxID=747656 RepID=A0A7Z0M6J2_9STRE|nr:helix-turn-helix transcriptional regulator [Streptococcus danieliae]NYS96626.1 helix-turn-helix transcriptional regulator [Streptococcus danieliae]